MPRRLPLLSLAVAVAFSVGCYLQGDDSGASDPPGSPTRIDPGPSPLRRLTNDEYDATVADLLGDTSKLAVAFPATSTSVAGYDTYATGLGVSADHVEAYLGAAETLATNAVKNLPALMKCDPTKDEGGCVASFVADFGKRAFRRPLTPAEIGRFQKLFADAKTTHSTTDSVRLVVEAFLMAPAFLYRLELASPGTGGSAFVNVDSWAMASRLSYLFLGSMPDAELFRAAAQDELRDRANVEKQARRLLQDPRAKLAFQRFADQWLELRGILSVQKDPTSVPGWDSSLAPLMKEEASRVVDEAAWQSGDLRTLFTADHTFVNGQLAAFYGMKGVSGGAFTRVQLDPSQRRGILTLGGVIAAHSKNADTLPPRVGKFVAAKIFCRDIGDPPANAAAQAPQRASGTSTRKWFEQIQAQPACGGCHKVLDGIGFGFEGFDPAGRVRTADGTTPVDASGALLGTDVDGPYVGAAELDAKIPASERAMACIAKQIFRWASGRPDTPNDAHSLATLTAAFRDHGYDARELLVALTQTDAFLLRPAQGGSQ
jgi:hypothetical protein